MRRVTKHFVRGTVAFAITAGLFIVSTAASADALVRYEFTSNSAAQTSGALNGSDVDTSTAGMSLTGDYLQFSVSGTANSLANSIADDDYAGFTLTNNSGLDAELETMTFIWWFNSPNSSETNEFYSTFVLSGEAPFADGNQLDEVTLPETGSDRFTFYQSRNNARPVSFDISSLGTLASGSSIEFRLYFADSRAGVSSPDQLIDDLTINGTLVPEPTSLALLGLGGLCALRRRRA